MKYIKYGLLTFILAVLFSHILSINPLSQFIGDGGDNFQYFGFMHLAHQNIASLKYPFAHTNTFQYPMGFEFSFGYDGAFPVLTGALLGFIIPLPVAYSIVMILMLWLNCFIAFVCFSMIGKLFNSHIQSKIYYLIPAVMYGWSPYVFGRINGHANLTFIAGFPLFAYAVLLFITRIQRGIILKLNHYLFLFCSVLVIASGSLQYLVLLSQLAVGLIICCFIFFRKDTLATVNTFFKGLHKEQVGYLIISGILFVSVFLFFYSGYIVSFITKQFMTAGMNNNSPLFIPSLIDFFVPNSYLGLWWKLLNHSQYELERVASYGIMGNLVLLIYLLHYRFSKQSFIIITTFLATIIFGKYIPPLLVPEPGRVFVLFSLIICIVLTIKPPKWSFVFILVIATALIGERALFRIQTTQPINLKVAEIVKKLPGKAVLNVPISDTSYKGTLAYFWGKSIVDGSLHYPARTKDIYKLWENPLLSRFICHVDQSITVFTPKEIEDLISLLKRLDIQTIILHKQAPGELWWFKECAQVRKSWYSLNPQFAVPSSKEVATQQKVEYGRDAKIQSMLTFGSSGMVELGGMSLWPPEINDFSIATAGGIITPPWKLAKNNKDLVADFIPPITLFVSAGNTFTLFSKKQVDSNTYVNLYYKYTPDNVYAKNTQTSAIILPSLKQIYVDDAIEVYSIR